MMLQHGGNLNDAIAAFGRPREEWIDLSTGINPHGYPVPQLAPSAWHRLPEPDADLLPAAQAYYGAPCMLAVAGSQAAIQALPKLRLQWGQPSRVVIAAPSYAEHVHCWKAAGHEVIETGYECLSAVFDKADPGTGTEVTPSCDVMVVCNPNNPTGARIDARTLLQWAAQLHERNGWLIVDEAFMDTTPQHSIAGDAGEPGLIVLRSVGKFFGLAGVRLGFVGAHPTLLSRLQESLGPWAVSGPAQQIGRMALRDLEWQRQTHDRLLVDGRRLESLLRSRGLETTGTALFRWWPEPDAAAFRMHMARRGIWVRLFESGAGGIRIGLPGDVIAWCRLEAALDDWVAGKSERHAR